MSNIIHYIEIKNKHVYDCMKRSELCKNWRWATGESMAGWSPYYVSGRPRPDDEIVLLVDEDDRVQYSTRGKYLEMAIPWAQWCILQQQSCSTCTYWACMNRKELIGACTIWHDSGKTWPKSWESCPQWKRTHNKKGEKKNV